MERVKIKIIIIGVIVLSLIISLTVALQSNPKEAEVEQIYKK